MIYVIPKDCLDVVVDSLIDSIFELYLPYDLMKDVHVLSELHGIPDLIDDTIKKLDKSKIDKGPPYPLCQFTPRFAISTSVIPEELLVLSKSKKTTLIPGDVARYYARQKYPDVYAWSFYIATKRLGTNHTPLSEAILRHWVSLSKTQVVYEKDLSNLREIIEEFPEADPKHALWIFDNFIKKSCNITKVKFYLAETNMEKHKIIMSVLCPPYSQDQFPINNYYDEAMLTRASKMCHSGVQDVAKLWEYVIDGTGERYLNDSAHDQFYKNLAKLSVKDDVIAYLTTLDQNKLRGCFSVIQCFASYNAKLIVNIYENDYVDDDDDDDYDIEIQDCIIRNQRFSDMPWKFDMFDTWPARTILDLDYCEAVDICETLTRYLNLQSALQAKNLELRSDSRLCEAYVLDDEGDIDHIVSVMLEMDIFFQNTKYPSYISLLNRAMFANKKTNSEIAKLAAIHTYNKTDYPERFKNISKSEMIKAYEQVMACDVVYDEYSSDDW